MTLPSTLILPLLVLVFIGDSVICVLAGISPYCQRSTGRRNVEGNSTKGQLSSPVGVRVRDEVQM